MAQYFGWISVPQSPNFEADKKLLENLGIKLGRYDLPTESFEDCEIPTDEILGLLDPLWGRFVWSLGV